MFGLIKNIIFAALLFGVGYLFGIQEVRFYKIISTSMEPTLEVNDRIIAVKPGTLTRGDIVVLRDPAGGRDRLTKRVIGVPGDRVTVVEGEVRVNGERIQEPYLKEKPSYEMRVYVPEGAYLVLGDNRNESEDSSTWGPVPRTMITGKVVCRYWPWERFRVF